MSFKTLLILITGNMFITSSLFFYNNKCSLFLMCLIVIKFNTMPSPVWNNHDLKYHSRFTNARLLYDRLDERLEWKHGRTYVPKGNKRLLCFVDDVNLSQVITFTCHYWSVLCVLCELHHQTRYMWCYQMYATH